MKTFGRLMLGVAVAGMALALAGCNTTKGAGEDIRQAGSGIERAADRNGANP